MKDRDYLPFLRDWNVNYRNLCTIIKRFLDTGFFFFYEIQPCTEKTLCTGWNAPCTETRHVWNEDDSKCWCALFLRWHEVLAREPITTKIRYSYSLSSPDFSDGNYFAPGITLHQPTEHNKLPTLGSRSPSFIADVVDIPVLSVLRSDWRSGQRSKKNQQK